MSATSRENRTEALVGLVVVLAAIAFVFFAWQRAGGGALLAGGDGVQVKASFPSASGVSVGTDVRIAGMKVGTVAAQRLDPASFQAELTLALQDGIKVPADSSAAITTEGLLGGSHIALLPGGSTEMLKSGDVILETQGAVDMMSLIGGVINRGSGSGGDGGAVPPASVLPRGPAVPIEDEAAATAEAEAAAAR